MEVKVLREDINEALKKVSVATERRSSLPLLNNVLLWAQGETLKIYGTDLENYLIYSTRAQVLKEGKALVNAKKLGQLFGALNLNSVELKTEGETLSIVGKGLNYRLPTANLEDYPDFDFSEVEEVGALTGNSLLEGIKYIEPFIGKGEENPAFGGAYLRGKDGEIHLVGTDGVRLSLYRSQGELKGSALIPKKSLKVLKSILTPLDEVKVKLSETFVVFEGQDFTFGVRLLEGEFPEYEGVIPQSFVGEVEVDKDVILRALRRLSALGEKKEVPVKIELIPELLKLSVKDPEFGFGEEEIPVEYFGESVSLSVNSKFLMDGIRVFRGKRVRMRVVGENEPLVLEEGEHYLCLIMPISL